ncbi:hypothetical protein GCM10023203_14700 [Actinomycetospora straminea]|uniref:RNA polymerase sigma factor n=1 Tax=Actinomycetospora straminea TaxID=663607 RepID=A0ABP9E6H3_9PSEU
MAGSGGRPRGATGTDTPPEPLLDARVHGQANGYGPVAPPTAPVAYPAQRRREDTWPPPDQTPADDPPRRPGRPGRHPEGRPTPPSGLPRPDTLPPAAGPAGPAVPAAPPVPPAPRTGTGPLPPTAAPPDLAGPPDLAVPPVDPGVPTAAVPLHPPGDPHTGALPEESASAGTAVDEELADELADDLPDDGATAEGWALVRLAQDGDTQAFGELFDRYHDTVFRFVLFRLGDRPAAEDLTQETFVRAFRRIASVSYQGRDIGAWFVTIARNLVLDHVKSSRYRLEHSTPEVADVAPSSVRPSPETEVIAGATHAELLRCVARLGDDQQECIALRFLQGLSVAETAEIMGRNEGAVKALQHRAVRRLAQLLPEGLR